MLKTNPFLNKTTLLIDFDGTLVDSEKVLYTAFEKLMEFCGKSTTPEQFELLKGTPVELVPQTLISTFNLPLDEKTLLMSYKKFLAQNYAPSLKLYADAKKFLELCTPTFTCILVTSASRKIVKPFLEKANIGYFFKDIICAEDVLHHKPEPTPYLKAISEFHIPKEAALVIEDSIPGLQSGFNAGLETLLLNHTIQDTSSFEPYSTFQAESFSELIERLQDIC